jgi:hypothetical protein
MLDPSIGQSGAIALQHAGRFIECPLSRHAAAGSADQNTATTKSRNAPFLLLCMIDESSSSILTINPRATGSSDLDHKLACPNPTTRIQYCSYFESAVVCNGCNIARTMQNAHNHDFLGVRKVIDCVFPVKDHAQIGGKMKTRGAGEWECRRLNETSLDVKKKIGRDRLGCFFRKVAPDLG